MNLTFLVGSAEPGANGVSDYTRLLAREVERQRPDVRCQLVALHDTDVDSPQRNDSDIVELRLPMTLPWSERIELSRHFLNEFSPEWISLQFVPYAFHPKGIVRGFAAHLQPLVEKRRLHIMFHELWIGQNVEADFKEIAIGAVQRHYVLQMARRLGPVAVSTSNGVYMAVLAHNALQAEHLPLFSNIPIVRAEPSDIQHFATLCHKVLPATPTDSFQQAMPLWTGVFFGSLHPTWKAEPLLSHLIEVAKQQQRRLCLMAVGRLGKSGESLWNEMSRNYGSDVMFVSWGEQSAEQISLLFQKADFGVATSPWQLIEKSSCVASMLDHGLPVIVNRDDWHWRGKDVVTAPNDSLLHRFDSVSPSALMNLQKRVPQERLPAVATEFLRQLRAGNFKH